MKSKVFTKSIEFSYYNNFSPIYDFETIIVPLGLLSESSESSSKSIKEFTLLENVKESFVSETSDESIQPDEWNI